MIFQFWKQWHAVVIPVLGGWQTSVSQATHKSLRIGGPKKPPENEESLTDIFMRVSEYASVPVAQPVPNPSPDSKFAS